MADEPRVDQIEAIGGSVKEMESRLLEIMNERRTIETAIENARIDEQRLHARASEIYADEGRLRKQIGDLRDVLEASGA